LPCRKFRKVYRFLIAICLLHACLLCVPGSSTDTVEACLVCMADYERAWRAKERAEAEKKAAQLADILKSREEMAIQKQRVMSQAAQMEKEQFQRILQVFAICLA